MNCLRVLKARNKIKRVASMGLILVLALSLSIPVFAEDGDSEELGYDMSQQNAVTEYALKFLDDPEVQYVWGGYGGRQYSSDGEVGENDGYWSLEQVKKYHSEWEPKVQYARCGTDCSGFVSAVFQHCGLYTGWSPVVSGMWAVGTEVSAEEAVPGDVVIYINSEGETYHCGIYLGNDKIIHTSTSSGYTGTSYGTVVAGNTVPTYPHISDVGYESGSVRFCRLVDDVGDYGTVSDSDSMSVALSGAIVHEEDMTGMPNCPALLEYQSHVKLPDYNNLSNSDKANIESIKTNKNAGKVTAMDVVSSVSSVLGVAVLIYDILMVACFVFDMVNSVFDFSVLSLITLGYLSVAGKKERKEAKDGKKHRKYISIGMLFVIVAILAVIGIALVSGVVVRFLYRISALI